MKSIDAAIEDGYLKAPEIVALCEVSQSKQNCRNGFEWKVTPSSRVVNGGVSRRKRLVMVLVYLCNWKRRTIHQFLSSCHPHARKFARTG